jgi:hypothetical protein
VGHWRLMLPVKKNLSGQNSVASKDRQGGWGLVRQPNTAAPLTCVIPDKTFICLPFSGGISAFAVILPRP